MSAATQKANEPSMEEILASIRRIIADDASAPPPPEEEKPAAAAQAEDLDVLDLATVPETAAPLIRTKDLEPLPQSVEMDEDIEFRFVDEEPPVPPKPAAVDPPPPPPPPKAEPVPDVLIGADVGAQVSNSFQVLATALIPQTGRTIEDLVKDMLRPLLKGWLDENLPGLVERLVKAEIERVTRGPR